MSKPLGVLACTLGLLATTTAAQACHRRHARCAAAPVAYNHPSPYAHAYPAPVAYAAPQYASAASGQAPAAASAAPTPAPAPVAVATPAASAAPVAVTPARPTYQYPTTAPESGAYYYTYDDSGKLIVQRWMDWVFRGGKDAGMPRPPLPVIGWFQGR